MLGTCPSHVIAKPAARSADSRGACGLRWLPRCRVLAPLPRQFEHLPVGEFKTQRFRIQQLSAHVQQLPVV